jgi:hypothetical protein
MDMKNPVFNATSLRYQTKKVVNLLKDGASLYLIHRSSIIGKIEPLKKIKEKTVEDIDKFLTLIKEIKPKKLIDPYKRKQIYLKHLKNRYEKDIS